MKDNIEVCLNRVKDIIDEIDSTEFSTVDVISKYSGGFYSNKGTPVNYSFNALFGKLLKRNQAILKIEKIKSGVVIKDDNGHETNTHTWKKCT
ncbi:hypothetical protein ACWXWU_20575 [Shewanella sp. A14]